MIKKKDRYKYMFLVHGRHCIHEETRKKKMIRSRAILIYNITYSLLPQILFCALYEMYTYTSSSNRTRGKARNVLQGIPSARETDSSKRLFPLLPLLPFSPLSFIRRISLREKIERRTIEKTSNVKERRVISKIVCVRVCERERERKHRDIHSRI